MLLHNRNREHFIPIRKADLVDAICRDFEMSAREQHDFRELCSMIEAMFHFEYHQKMEELKNCYAPFDPDSDTCKLDLLSPEEKPQLLEELFTQFTWLLERANFRRLTREDIREALQASSDWGLNLDVDFGVFDRLEVYARGEASEYRRQRKLRNWLRPVKVEVPIFHRLVIILRLKHHPRLKGTIDTEHVYIKVFRDIPKMDLEMLLPGTRIRMKLSDLGRITLPLSVGLAVAGWQLAGGLATLIASKGLLGSLGFAGGTVGYGARSFFGYQNSKRKYMLTLTQSLYFLNLDSNAGVLFRLLDEAEEQECKEAFLAYYFLWRHARPEGWSAHELDDHIEKFLNAKIQQPIDFEIGDALEKLERLNIIQILPNGQIKSLPINEALRTLDDAWDHFFRHSNTRLLLAVA